MSSWTADAYSGIEAKALDAIGVCGASAIGSDVVLQLIAVVIVKIHKIGPLQTASCMSVNGSGSGRKVSRILDPAERF